MTVTRETIAIPDSTEPTISLLRELRRDQVKKRAANAAYWVYLVALVAGLYGGTQIAAAFRALRRPPPPTAQTPLALHAAPYALTVVALVVLLALLRDALWRGPVTLPQVTVDWLLGTPVDRGRLLRPRFRISALLTVAAGAVVGIVPVAALIAFGLSGRGAGSALRVTGLAMASVALLFALGTGCAGLIERHPAAGRWLRRVTPAAITAAAVIAGLAAWAALGRPPAALAAVVLWSGPWGWAAQGMTGLAARDRRRESSAAVAVRDPAARRGGRGGGGGRAPRRGRGARRRAPGPGPHPRGDVGGGAEHGYPGRGQRLRQRVAPGPGPAAPAAAPAPGTGPALARPARAGPDTVAARGRGRAFPAGRGPDRRRGPPQRTGGAAAGGVRAGPGLPGRGLAVRGGQAGRGGHPALGEPAAAVLGAGLVARGRAVRGAAGGRGPAGRGGGGGHRRPAVPGPAGRGRARLVAGALVNVFRGEFAPDMFAGVDTPGGNTAAYRILFWYAWGPLLAVAPMAVLLSSAIGATRPGAVARAVVIGAGLAVALLTYAARRAARLRAA